MLKWIQYNGWLDGLQKVGEAGRLGGPDVSTQMSIGLCSFEPPGGGGDSGLRAVSKDSEDGMEVREVKEVRLCGSRRGLVS